MEFRPFLYYLRGVSNSRFIQRGESYRRPGWVSYRVRDYGGPGLYDIELCFRARGIQQVFIYTLYSGKRRTGNSLRWHCQGELRFLWFNCFPASVFMGDVGSLSLGGNRGNRGFYPKRISPGHLGGIFVVEAVSVILQVGSFRLRGEKGYLRLLPLHHHFQVSGWPESKVIVRFWIIGIILAVVTLATLKIR